jgi:hypothetical protein
MSQSIHCKGCRRTLALCGEAKLVGHSDSWLVQDGPFASRGIGTDNNEKLRQRAVRSFRGIPVGPMEPA